MKKTINVHDFRQAFVDMGRKDQFSYEALGAIFDYLESLEEDTGTEIELDPIAVCCEFVECDLDEIKDQYSLDLDDDADLDDAAEALSNETSVVATLDDTIVFAQF